MTSMSDSDLEALAYLGKIAREEQQPDHQKYTITCGPFSTFTLVSVLQLASRHPHLNPGQYGIIETMISQVLPVFDGTPLEQVLAQGNDPACDVFEGPPGDDPARIFQITDPDNSVISADVRNPGNTDGHRVRLGIDTASSWLTPDDAELLGAALLARAAEARHRDASDAVIQQQGEQAIQWLTEHPGAVGPVIMEHHTAPDAT